MSSSSRFWLLKTEPNCFCWDEQLKAGIEPWDGVRNFQARKNMYAMEVGDLCFFYHTGKERSVVGIVEVASATYPDPTDSEGKWPCIDVKTVKSFKNPVALKWMKMDSVLENADFLRQGRLSVAELTKEEFDRICLLGETQI
ncbi:EVE domain-containing protein [Acetobacteraceae bacterium]|nr:EVE domain-containing protein [Acetobacteraceae bacterium]